MTYSEAENKRWWDGLGVIGRDELLDKIQARCTSPRILDMVDQVRESLELQGYKSVEDDQLVHLRKWI